MGRNPIGKYISEKLTPEEVYRFFEGREGFDDLVGLLGPPRQESPAIPKGALSRVRAELKKAGRKGLGVPVPKDFSPAGILCDLAAGYDAKVHQRARAIAWYLCLYLFSHEDKGSPFVSKDRREARFADAVKSAPGPVLYLPNYNSHFDSAMIAVYLDSLGLGLPFAALGD